MEMKSYFQTTSVSHAYIYLCGLGFLGDVLCFGGIVGFGLFFCFLFLTYCFGFGGGRDKGEFGWFGLE